MMPGLLMNYQQRPLNIFDRWLHAPPNQLQTIVEPTDVEYDGRTLFNRAKFQLACGAGPASLPQRQMVGIVGGSDALKNSWPFVVSCSLSNLNLRFKILNLYLSLIGGTEI
jgi:hypothetical protein